MQSAMDLKKLVTNELSKTAITDLISSVAKSRLPDASKRTALEALSDAFVSISKGDEAAAARAVEKARGAIRARVGR